MSNLPRVAAIGVATAVGALALKFLLTLSVRHGVHLAFGDMHEEQHEVGRHLDADHFAALAAD